MWKSHVRFSFFVDRFFVLKQNFDGLDELLVDGMQESIFRLDLQQQLESFKLESPTLIRKIEKPVYLDQTHKMFHSPYKYKIEHQAFLLQRQWRKGQSTHLLKRWPGFDSRGRKNSSYKFI